MWTAIQYVGSGLTLVAFLAALAAWLYRRQLLIKERLIQSVPEGKRAELVERTLVLFKVDTHRLTKKQQYDLALEQIREQARKFKLTAGVIVIIAIIAAALTVAAIWQINPATTGSLSGDIDEAAVVPDQGGNSRLFIHLLIKNAGSPTPVNHYAVHIKHVTSKSIEYDGGFQEINDRYTIPETGGRQPIVIQPQDSIIRKTQEAIGKDQKVDGWLMLALPLPEGVMRQPGMRYTVSFADAYGKKYEAGYEMR